MAHDATVEGYKLGADGAGIQSTEESSSSIAENSTQKSYEELYKLPYEYTSAMALEDGDVICVNGVDYNVENLIDLLKIIKIINYSLIISWIL